MTLLEVNDLRVGVRVRLGKTIPVVRGISFSLERGQRVGLVGESGCGKSVTALSIMRLLQPPLEIMQGQVLLQGTDVLLLSEREMRGIRGGKIAMIDQNSLAALNPVLTIGAQLVEAIRLHSDLSKHDARQRAADLLAEVGITEPHERLKAFPHEFSGGMRQRVIIAMALSGQPDLIIADEPTTALDVTTQARIMDMLDELSRHHGMSVLLITHDLGVTAGFCDQVQVMYAGRIVECAEIDTLYRRPVHPYTEALLDAVCDLTTPIGAKIRTIGGSPPVPGELIETACSFSPRCPYVQEICNREQPTLTSVAAGAAECHFANERIRAFANEGSRAQPEVLVEQELRDG